MSKLILNINDRPMTLEALERKSGEVRFRIDEKQYAFRAGRCVGGEFLLEEEILPGVWKRTGGAVAAGVKGARRVQLGALEAIVSEMRAGASGVSQAGALAPTAPMPGLIRQVLVKAGDQVARGQTLVVMEAMKLQLALPAGGDATVEAVLVAEGHMVSEGAELVRLKAG